MPILTIIITLVIVGFLLWAVNSLIPMQATVKKLLNIVIVVILIIWLLKIFGVWNSLGAARI